jgi:hypothetical protein
MPQTAVLAPGPALPPRACSPFIPLPLSPRPAPRLTEFRCPLQHRDLPARLRQGDRRGQPRDPAPGHHRHQSASHYSSPRCPVRPGGTSAEPHQPRADGPPSSRRSPILPRLLLRFVVTITAGRCDRASPLLPPSAARKRIRAAASQPVTPRHGQGAIPMPVPGNPDSRPHSAPLAPKQASRRNPAAPAPRLSGAAQRRDHRASR